MVTVVDHLGNVSANLEGLISQTSAFSEAESRIQCLKQVSVATLHLFKTYITVCCLKIRICIKQRAMIFANQFVTLNNLYMLPNSLFVCFAD